MFTSVSVIRIRLSSLKILTTAIHFWWSGKRNGDSGADGLAWSRDRKSHPGAGAGSPTWFEALTEEEYMALGHA
jgi:hypothetical protein